MSLLWPTNNHTKLPGARVKEMGTRPRLVKLLPIIVVLPICCAITPFRYAQGIDTNQTCQWWMDRKSLARPHCTTLLLMRGVNPALFESNTKPWEESSDNEVCNKPSRRDPSLFLKTTNASLIWAMVSAGNLTSVAAVSFRSNDRNIIGRLNRQSALHVPLQWCCAKGHAKTVSTAGLLAKGKRSGCGHLPYGILLWSMCNTHLSSVLEEGLSTVAADFLTPTAPGNLARPMWKWTEGSLLILS